MKSSLRLNRQPKHVLARLGLRGVKPGNREQFARAHRVTFRHKKGGFDGR